MKPRYYQEEAVVSIFDYFAAGNTGNPIVAMPTGTGKSPVIGWFIQRVLQIYPNQNIMMLTHVQELIEQNFSKLMTIWPTAPAGIYSAGLNRRDTAQQVIYGGIGSVNNKTDQFSTPDLILIDECHLVSDKDNTMYRQVIDAWKEKNPHLKIIGFTATKYRMGLGMLTDGGLFTDVCYDVTTMDAFNRLIAEGFLAPLIPKRTRMEIDVNGIKKQGGEYNKRQMQQASDQEEITYAAISEMVELGQDRRKWLIFATGVEHSENIVAMLDSFDIPSAAVHSKMTKAQRAEALRAFEFGELRCLVNNNVLTTGFDEPEIDLIGVLRPTMSPGLWVQMLGRGTRPVYADGFDLDSMQGRLAAMANSCKQDCLVLDFAGNTKRLGPINDPVLPKKKGKKGGTAPVRICEVCGSYVHASLRICPVCENEFPRQVKIIPQAAMDELLANSTPIIETCKVDKVIYTRHNRNKDKPPTLRVTYYCGLKHYSEYLCYEHTGFPRKKAVDWWDERFGHDIYAPPVPETIDEALKEITSAVPPTSINVWINKKYPEILSYDY